MSFVDNYLTDPLAPLSDKAKANLEKLESDLREQIQALDSTSFDDMLKQHSSEIIDLVNRFKKASEELRPFKLGNIPSLFRFIYNIAYEVHQIVAGMSSAIIKDGMTDAQKHQAKVDFGQKLIYFIYMAVNPLKDYFVWLPFKATIEKKLIFWLSGMALNSVVDLFKTHTLNTGIQRGF